MIQITAIPWVPPFAQGNVRDLRARWALEEAGAEYGVKLVSQTDRESAEYRDMQPFGQVPVYEENGLTLFESGAIVLHVAKRSPVLWPASENEQAEVVQWCFAAYNSIEPFMMSLAEIDFFYTDARWAIERRPVVVEQIRGCLGNLQKALGERHTLLGQFTAADILMTTVLRILRHTEILQEFPALAAYRDRHEARPAFQRALQAQLAVFEKHEPPH